MADPTILVTLRKKRDDITAAINAYQKRLDDSKRELGHVNATIRIFELGGDPADVRVHASTRSMFGRREIATLCKGFLESEGPLDTRELARRIMRVKGLDEGDEPLRITVTYRVTQALRFEERRGGVKGGELRRGVKVWNVSAGG